MEDQRGRPAWKTSVEDQRGRPAWKTSVEDSRGNATGRLHTIRWGVARVPLSTLSKVSQNVRLTLLAGAQCYKIFTLSKMSQNVRLTLLAGA
ncbi:hypothetical protein E5D57_013344 [Metarhizium anisopliae]|nr:hypothetical protein E5D57_013344 [Metarhizium anisopliae]